MSPSSSPMMAKMKSVWASGRKNSFCRLVAQPQAEEAARADGHQRLGHLVADVVPVRPRIQEGHDALHAGTGEWAMAAYASGSASSTEPTR